MPQKITWFAALKILQQGKPEILGKSAKSAKSMQMGLSIALMSTLAALLFPIYVVVLYSGATPPKAPVIKATGTLNAMGAHNLNGGAAIDVVLSAVDGKKFTVKNSVGIQELQDFAKNNPMDKVYVEGFLLQNGSGSFWPTSVSNIDGRIIISKDKLQVMYNYRKSKGPIKVGLVLLLISAPFWISSIYHAYKIRLNTSTEEE